MLDPDPPATPTSPTSHDGAAWRSRADALAARVNLGWCLDQLVLALPLAAVVATALVLYLRMAGFAEGWVYVGGALPLLGAVGYAWHRARRRFIDRRQALVRLESSLQLHASLSSAAQGVGRWPAAQGDPSPLLRWRWEKSFLPPLFSILLVAAAVLWPLPASVLAGDAALPKPRNIEALETILEQLKEQPLIAEEDLSTLDREIGKLGKGRESLYKPSTLEAADHLAKRTSEALSKLANSSASARRALQAAIDPNSGAKVRAKQAEDLEAAVKQMADAAMRAPADLLDALKDGAANGMQDLDAEAAKRLHELLEQNQQQFQEMLQQLGFEEFPGGAWAGGEGGGEPGEGDGPGVGGPAHGDAPPAPLRFHGEDRGVDGGRLEGLGSHQGASSPGELLELRAVRPPDPDAPLEVESSGQPSREGGGGARLWKENLDPDEQRFLGEFYR